jgi:polyhydroxyalkanoate synthase subunit PhaC
MIGDPFGIGRTFLTLQMGWLSHPQEWPGAQRELATTGWMLATNALQYLACGSCPPLTAAVEDDERFAGPAWQEYRPYCMLMQRYLAYSRLAQRLVYDTPGVSKADGRIGAYWTKLWLNALAPSNFLLTNPEALHKAYDSGGASLRRGFQNWLDDVQAGDLRMVDNTPFHPGENVANTPGAVVFRSELMEVIQYYPLREQVHAMPVVIVPPWINKYYILDLNEKKSMVRFLLAEGFSVFTISWKNPGREMAECSYEDHVLNGALKAIEVAKAISGVPQVHAVGYCIGGTALTTLMAWLNRKYRKADDIPVAHWTLLASLADFSRPGDVSAFINEESVATLEALMAMQGYMDAPQISWSFRLLRPNSLIWHYVIHKYLFGEAPLAHDVLAWNVDSVRLPRATHSFCLRNLYLENQLARKDAIEMRGYRLDLGRIRQPLYMVAAKDDHITPWQGTFRTVALLQCPVRYALSTSGHILGIINPPGPDSKREYWVGDATGMSNRRAWLASQDKLAGSWWNDWSDWLHQRCGPLQWPAAVGNKQYPRLCDAPGTYIHEH